MSRQQAERYVEEANRVRLGGHNTWRLPTLEELHVLFEGMHPSMDIAGQEMLDR